MPPLTRRTLLTSALATLAAAPAAPGIRIMAASGGYLVPVTLDGKPAKLLLDTGADRTILARDAVIRLGLRRDRWVSTTLRGAGGLLDRRANADLRSAHAGEAALFLGLPGKVISLPVTTADLRGADGLLGGDMLRHETLDLDLASGRLAFIPPPEAPQDGAVKLQMLRGLLPAVPVHLDGHKLIALIDTGSTVSIVNARGLYRMGLAAREAPSGRATLLTGIGGQSPATVRRFKTLSLGKLTFPNPALLTEAVPEAAFDMVLGLDLLGRQRLVLSYQAETLYFPPS